MLRCICGAAMNRKWFSQKFDAMRCPDCESCKFVDSGSDSLVEYRYDSSDDKYGNKTYLNRPEFRWAHNELAKDDWQGRSVLEIGCFTGFFLDRLRALGADVMGVEVNNQAAAAGSELYDLQGRILPCLEAVSPGKRFDRILMIDVLEHIEQPATFVAAACDLLVPGGLLSISSPTIERRFHDKSDFPPHHQWWFSREGMRRMTARLGLKPAGAAIQRDGLLLVRNLLGRLIYGFSRREFNGSGSETISSIARSGDRTQLYAAVSRVGNVALRAIGMQYCSYMLHVRGADR